ncbi:ethanolamine ammonia-lyase subunit EutB [bacterium]|nr:ethanolamine ammonia-lyase subunit EutB [bacterium]
MRSYQTLAGKKSYRFPSLVDVLAKASPARSGDLLAGVAALQEEERVAAQMCLADVPLKEFIQNPAIPYESDEVTRVIWDAWDETAFAPISHLTLGEFREFLLDSKTTGQQLNLLAPGLLPEMVAAVSKIMRNQDLITVAQKLEVITHFRSTVGKKGHLSIRVQPNHPTDDLKAIAAATLDGLLYGCGDAVIGINPAGESVERMMELQRFLADLIDAFKIPTQSCVLGHITHQMSCMERGVPVDLVFQSIGGTERTNQSFGVTIAMLKEAQEAALSLKRGGHQVMYFETGQGSSLSAQAHQGVDQQTLEVRAYGLARLFNPFLVNSVVGFIGPEYLYDGKQIVRAGLEDHFCGKLLGLPMGCDVCYTNHAQADQDDMDTLLTLLGVAGCNYFMGVPGADDIMLNYQSTSFHDARYVRDILRLRPAPEFETWLEQVGIHDSQGKLVHRESSQKLAHTLQQLLPSGKT